MEESDFRKYGKIGLLSAKIYEILINSRLTAAERIYIIKMQTIAERAF